MNETFYSILQISENATQEEIKSSYRKLSMKYHPDKNRGDPESTSKFQKISEAYETLGDPEKKKQYDMSRNNPFAKMMGQHPGEMNIDPMEHIFSNMFNFGMPFAHMNSFNSETPNNNPFVQIFHNGKPINVQFGGNMIKPSPIIKNISVSIEQVLNGTKMPIEIERWIVQPGSNSEKSKVFEKETLYIDIPKGVDSGEIIILNDKGNILENGIKGDVKLFMQVENNTEFKRRGIDLVLEKTISLKESLCGFNFDIKFITGKVYTISNPSGNVIPPGHNKIIPNLGLTRDGITGNLIIIFTIKFPEKLQDNIVEELRKINF